MTQGYVDIHSAQPDENAYVRDDWSDEGSSGGSSRDSWGSDAETEPTDTAHGRRGSASGSAGGDGDGAGGGSGKRRRRRPRAAPAWWGDTYPDLRAAIDAAIKVRPLSAALAHPLR